MYSTVFFAALWMRFTWMNCSFWSSPFRSSPNRPNWRIDCTHRRHCEYINWSNYWASSDPDVISAISVAAMIVIITIIISTLAERNMSALLSSLLLRTINLTIIVDLYALSSSQSSDVVSCLHSEIPFYVFTSTRTMSVFIVKFVCAHNRFIMCCVAFNVKVIHMLNKFVANCLWYGNRALCALCVNKIWAIAWMNETWNSIQKKWLKVYKQWGPHIHGFDRKNRSNRTNAERSTYVPTLHILVRVLKRNNG